MYGGDKDIDHQNAMAEDFNNEEYERWFDSRNAENNHNESNQ